MAQARVGIVPLRIAGGIRMKLLDSFARGLPAVATSVGARGLEFDDGVGGFTRDDPVGFAEAVVGLLTDDLLWTRTVSAGQAFLASHHSEAGLDAALESGIKVAIEHSHAGAGARE